MGEGKRTGVFILMPSGKRAQPFKGLHDEGKGGSSQGGVTSSALYSGKVALVAVHGRLECTRAV